MGSTPLPKPARPPSSNPAGPFAILRSLRRQMSTGSRWCSRADGTLDTSEGLKTHQWDPLLGGLSRLKSAPTRFCGVRREGLTMAIENQDVRWFVALGVLML